MSVCTQSQVNVFRNSVDEMLWENSNKMAIVILHFPPEMGISSRPCYHAVFLNQWDFMYVDTLGVTTGQAKEDEQLRQEVNPEENMEDRFVINNGDEEDDGEKPVLEVDAKTWIAKGFGLNTSIHYAL